MEPVAYEMEAVSLSHLPPSRETTRSRWLHRLHFLHTTVVEPELDEGALGIDFASLKTWYTKMHRFGLYTSYYK